METPTASPTDTVCADPITLVSDFGFCDGLLTITRVDFDNLRFRIRAVDCSFEGAIKYFKGITIEEILDSLEQAYKEFLVREKNGLPITVH